MMDAMVPFAHALADAAAGRKAVMRFRREHGDEIHERDAHVFLEPLRYTAVEKRLLDRLCELPRGSRFLDVGCGAGRHARWLLAHGYPVDAIDTSPDVVAVAQSLGTRARVASVWDLDEPYDAAFLLGNSIGLCGSVERLHDLLGHLSDLTPLVLLDSVDPGTKRGVDRFRIEYAGEVGDWFEWLHVAPSDLLAAAQQAGFVCELFEGDDGSYGAVLTPAAPLAA
jgi:SAM-dependent methyltransferase